MIAQIVDTKVNPGTVAVEGRSDECLHGMNDGRLAKSDRPVYKWWIVSKCCWFPNAMKMVLEYFYELQ